MVHSLIPAYRELHRKGYFRGLSIRPHLGQIADLVMASGAKSLLDYGSGAGDQYEVECYHVLWNVKPTCYDPAVKAFSKRPVGRFDGVLVIDVLEHIPIDELDEVIAELVGYSRRWCFASVCCRPAKSHKNLPHGQNAHCTIRPETWWREKLGTAFDGRAQLHLAFTP